MVLVDVDISTIPTDGKEQLSENDDRFKKSRGAMACRESSPKAPQAEEKCTHLQSTNTNGMNYMNH